MQSKCIRRKCSHYFDEKGSDDVKINDLYHPLNCPSEKSNKRTSFHQHHSSYSMHQPNLNEKGFDERFRETNYFIPHGDGVY